MTGDEILTFHAPGGERLDKTIIDHIGDRLTRTQVQALIRAGKVSVDAAPAKPGLKLKGGEQIRVLIPPPAQDETIAAEPIALNVIYEDRDLAVIDKPAGMVVHPGAGNETGTLVNALLARYPEIGLMEHTPKRRGIVHRLDKDTSGLIVVARNAPTLHRLMTQFQRRSVDKIYLALLEREPPTPTGRIEAPIGRDPNQRRKMAVMRGGRPAISEYAIIERFASGHVLAQVKLLTGRTHQVRVHMAFINCPLVGDKVYGFRRQRLELDGQFLHAAQLAFDHPRTGERLRFESPLPVRLAEVLRQLREAR
jgi:23S rRNA pseudouridine1911/1915/1917 synthase